MISCRDALEQVSEAILGGSPRDEEVIRHLEGCPSCRSEARILEATWRRVELLPAGEPGPRLQRRFEAMLAEAVEREGVARDARNRWGSRLAAFWRGSGRETAFAYAMAALVIGLLGGVFLSSRAPNPQVEGLRAQVSSLHEMVALSLLEQESASRRLKGVRHGSEVGAPRPPLQDALVEAVDRDPNVNVRLAALDALTAVAGETRVMNRLLRSLPEQESALVQIAMVDLLLAADGDAARRVVAQLAEDPDLPVEVRRHIHARLGSET